MGICTTNKKRGAKADLVQRQKSSNSQIWLNILQWIPLPWGLGYRDDIHPILDIYRCGLTKNPIFLKCFENKNMTIFLRIKWLIGIASIS
ncbi:hypothetical protein [Pectobacterium odoriferum]|uniref:Uncharacterized protein n=1 Tax=Pectobacterium odoriferum TaxID=78398 RepID=A0ABR4VN68_9GAMM|nr:hypothetical protein [Pectobacterium odoriferum]AIU87636.1 hypothetical protein BCS7_05225 [Pectobacterium odoriferum]KGA37838.1 hypothetical protein KS43_06415 [Pectobacterium odoriferum]KGA40832.1 hypothetical protein KU75_15380 [Pectobacterium odoriferum]MCA6959958.1 hypothetical protein [Pectobacterium odoriferum]MCH5008077.1 hypothetical protein [Pectobacterium odoriferum]